VVVATDARFTKTQCHLLAVAAHDGFARALRPSHMSADGDAAIVLATGRVDGHVDRGAWVAAEITAAAIRAAVGPGVVEWQP
jgi:L-aminopeptidase/D-esterase-like protein